VQGADFARSIATAPQYGAARDARVWEAIQAGGLVAWPVVRVPMPGSGGRAEILVPTDVASIGTRADRVRVPMSAPLAQRTADLLGAMLPTPAMVDAIWAASKKLAPAPMKAGPEMMSWPYALTHNTTIERQLSAAGLDPGAGDLIAGHKKDVVLSRRMVERPGYVGIYGWHLATGKPIQPVSYVHEAQYADYSHGARFVLGATVDGAPVSLAAALSGKLGADVAKMFSGEGALSVTRYPTGALPASSPAAAPAPAPAPVPAPSALLAASAPSQSSSGAFGAAVLEAARRDLAAGVREGTPEGEARIAAMMRLANYPGKGNWCAAAVSAWIKEAAAALGRKSPILGSAGAKNLLSQLQAAGLVRTAAQLRGVLLRPGDVLFWHRGPPGAWTGHTGVAEVPGATADDAAGTIEGNTTATADRVARQVRSRNDPNLLGVARLDGWGGPAPAPTGPKAGPAPSGPTSPAAPPPRPNAGPGKGDAWARDVVTKAFALVVGRAPTLAERQAVQAVTRFEGGYGSGWGSSGGAGSNNWGAVQGSGSAGSFQHVDTHADGSKYTTAFKRYSSAEEGAADVVRLLTTLRPWVLHVLGSGSATAQATEMRRHVKIGEPMWPGGPKAERENWGYMEAAVPMYASAIARNARELAANLGEPLAVTLDGSGRAPGGGPSAPSSNGGAGGMALLAGGSLSPTPTPRARAPAPSSLRGLVATGDDGDDVVITGPGTKDYIRKIDAGADLFLAQLQTDAASPTRKAPAEFFGTYQGWLLRWKAFVGENLAKWDVSFGWADVYEQARIWNAQLDDFRRQFQAFGGAVVGPIGPGTTAQKRDEGVLATITSWLPWIAVGLGAAGLYVMTRDK